MTAFGNKKAGGASRHHLFYSPVENSGYLLATQIPLIKEPHPYTCQRYYCNQDPVINIRKDRRTGINDDANRLTKCAEVNGEGSKENHKSAEQPESHQF